jgi:hypothetical protein
MERAATRTEVLRQPDGRPHARPAARTKAKGRFLSRDLALSVRFSEIWFGFQITALVTPESFGTYELTPVFTSLFHDHSRCKKLPTAIRLQLPGLSLVDDSRRRLLVPSLLWKIALPLKAILLSRKGNASTSGYFLLWK